ncbi:MAG: thermonuclease family protein [Hyphomicrobium aestuarii]|nr:thermonuclease family protein [Hyphomicrobium aestuarii]
MLRFASFAGAAAAAVIGGVTAGLIPIDPSGARPAPGSQFSPAVGNIRVPSPGSNPAPVPDRPTAPVAPAWIEGAARIVDGDTIDVAGTRIRLEGIDAPEAGQLCNRRDGGTWDCGTEATRVLTSLINGSAVQCAVEGRDVYGRTLGTCFPARREETPQRRGSITEGAIRAETPQRRVSINAEMVRRGLAWAFVKYSSTYVGEEAAARQAQNGIWQAATRTASDHRATRWVSASEAAPDGCAIKGNISHSGRIYHMPWSPWYAKVVMRADKGTRWFCSEAEAVAAGWRAAYAP